MSAFDRLIADCDAAAEKRAAERVARDRRDRIVRLVSWPVFASPFVAATGYIGWNHFGSLGAIALPAVFVIWVLSWVGVIR